MKAKRTVDIVMTFLLLFLMSYQVTEQAAHEWLGLGMTALVILHQILNRKWYAALFRRKYGAIRVLQTCVNVLLLSSFLPFCSHGGGRFGQSLTAIAKLAPDAALGSGLSVHYSGGASMPQDVTDCLSQNGIA